jgi:hypothetical protein
MSAWFAITQGRLRSIPDYVEAGINAAPHASVAIQLAAQAAKAHARMGNRSDVRRALDQGTRLLNDHEHPSRQKTTSSSTPQSGTSTPWTGTASPVTTHAPQKTPRRSSGYRHAQMAATAARCEPAKPDSLSPSCLSETTTFDGATEWARKAFNTDRRSVNSLSTVADELYHEARAYYGDEPAINALNDVIASFYASVSDR